MYLTPGRGAFLVREQDTAGRPLFDVARQVLSPFMYQVPFRFGARSRRPLSSKGWAAAGAASNNRVGTIINIRFIAAPLQR